MPSEACLHQLITELCNLCWLTFMLIKLFENECIKQSFVKGLNTLYIYTHLRVSIYLQTQYYVAFFGRV